MKSAKRLLQFLSRNKKSISPLLVLTHNYPDPDSIASAFALHYLARNHYGIDSKIAYGGLISRIENRYMATLLKIPLNKLKASDFKKYPHVALVDTQPGFGNNSFPKDARATIVIDQHPSTTKPLADLVIVDPERDATCEILAQALLSLKIDIPVTLRTALVYGILSDTLNLYRVRRRAIVNIYSSLLPHCNMKILTRLQNPPRSKEFFTMLNKGIKNATVYGNLIYSHLGFVKDPVFVAHTADFLLPYKDMRWSLCTGRYKKKLNISLRAVDLDEKAYDILRDVVKDTTRAGGHGSIAGGTVDVEEKFGEHAWKKAEEELTHRLARKIRLYSTKKLYYPFRKGDDTW